MNIFVIKKVFYLETSKKSLNFSPASAEIINMKLNVHYVILILIIFSLQIIFYSNFRQYELGSKIDQLTLQKLKVENEKMQLALMSSQLNSGRHPASIVKMKNHSEPLEMSGFYFIKADEYKKNKQINLAVNYLDKVKLNSFDLDAVAKASFYKVELICEQKLEDQCLTEIDFLITQHPESQWTGRSLKLLSAYYKKNQRRLESDSIDAIIKQYFSSKRGAGSEDRRL